VQLDVDADATEVSDDDVGHMRPLVTPDRHSHRTNCTAARL